MIWVKRGQTSVTFRVKLLNSSVSTGAGLTGLTNASSGLIISTLADNEATATVYTVAASNVESITTLGTYAAPTSGKCRFKEVDATNHPGLYEIQLADARFAVANAKRLVVSLSGATNLAQCDVAILLTDLDPYDAIRAGLTAMPNVASGNAGALLTAGTGTAQLSVTGGVGNANVTQIAGAAVNTGTAQLGVNVVNAAGTAWGSGAITAASIASAAITSAKFGAGALDANALATDAVTEIRDAITGGAYSLATDSNGRIRIVDGTGAGELDTASGSVNLTSAAVNLVADQVWDELTATHTGIGSTGAALTSAAIDPLNVSVPGAYAAGTVGYVIGTNLDAAMSSRATAASVWSNGTRDLTLGGVAAIADAVWDEALSGHLTAGSTGNALNAAGAAGDPWSTLIPGAYGIGTAGYIVGTLLDAAISSRATAASVWANATRTLSALGFTLAASDLASGILTAAKFGANAIDAAALATDAVQEIRNAVTGGAYALSTDANGRVRIVDGTAAGELDTSSGTVIAGSLAAQAKTDVNAEIVDALATDTYAEPGQGAPGHTLSLASKMGYLYKAWRNRSLQTADTYSLYDAAGTVVDQKAATSDDGTTATRGVVTSGP